MSYIAAADVQSQLNASYSSAGTAYTVYGLPVSQASFQAHVDFANSYIADIAGSVASATALKLAALDIACIRILVICMGGSLVGAFDYFLGDLRVARAGPYKEAITATLQGLKEDLSRQLVNLTPVAVAFDPAAAGDVQSYQGGLMTP
jgi:hypothetical protein